jgi:hypothetical protein
LGLPLWWLRLPRLPLWRRLRLPLRRLRGLRIVLRLVGRLPHLLMWPTL